MPGYDPIKLSEIVEKQVTMRRGGELLRRYH